MKRFLLAILLIMTATAGQAQSLTPFFYQPGTNEFHSMAAMSGSYVTGVQDTAGATVDTTYISPRYNRTYIVYTPKDSSAIAFKSLKGASYGDRLTIDITNPTITGNFVYLFGNWVVSTGTNKIALTSAKKSRLIFEFDGAKFIEVSRNLNY